MVLGSCSSRVRTSSRWTVDAGLGCDAGGDAAGELDAVDGEGVAGGDGEASASARRMEAGAAHLLASGARGRCFRTRT